MTNTGKQEWWEQEFDQLDATGLLLSTDSNRNLQVAKDFVMRVRTFLRHVAETEREKAIRECIQLLDKWHVAGMGATKYLRELGYDDGDEVNMGEMEEIADGYGHELINHLRRIERLLPTPSPKKI